MNLFINNSRLVILVLVSLGLLGIKGLLQLKKESRPTVDFATATLTTVYPGSSPSEVEELITNKIEDEIRSVEGLKTIQSHSQAGLSFIHIRVDMDNFDSTQVINDLYHSLQKVRDLPSEVLDPPRLTHMKANTNNPVLTLIVTGPDQHRQRDEIAFQLKSHIERIPGVTEVIMDNYRKRELQILLSMKQMEKHYISLADVVSSVKKQSLDIPAGYLEGKNKKHLVRLSEKARTAKELEEMVIRSNFSGKKVLIKDVGQVIDGMEKPSSFQYFFNSEGEKPFHFSPSVSLKIIKAEGKDDIQLVSKIQSIVQKFEQYINPNYKIHTFYSEGKRTRQRLIAVINNAVTGLLLVFLIFFFFLPSRTGLMAAFSLPFSILASFAFLPFMGVTFNVITMLAFVICIGMLVDNSVVIAEYYSRLTSNGNSAPKEAALLSVQRFWKPVTATVLTTIAAFLPMLVTTGVMGQFIKWIPIVVTVVLLMSLVESFFLLPSRLNWLPPLKRKQKHQLAILQGLTFLENKFEIFIQKVLSRKYLSLSCIGLLFLSGLLVHRLGNKVDLFDRKSPEFYIANFTMPPNTPLDVTKKEVQRITKQIHQTIGPQNLKTLMAQTSTSEKGIIRVSVRPSVLRKLDHKQILNSLRNIDKGQVKTLLFNALAMGPPRDKPLKAVILSNERKEIKNFIEGILPKVKEIPGIWNLEIDPDPETGKEYKVQLKQDILPRLGLDTQKAGMALRTALEGHLITELTDKGESFYIRVKKDEKELSSLDDLGKIQIREPFGRLIPLKQIAEIIETKAEPDKKKYNFHPSLALQAEINEKITTSLEVNQKVKKIIEEKIKDHPNLSYKLIGEQETVSESLQSLFNASMIAIFAIFVILIVLFKSFTLSLLILSCIPLGLIGVSWAFFLHQRSLNFFAMIGIVGLAGVVVNSAIILVSYIEQLKKDHPSVPLMDTVIQASKLRFRPILITNLTTLGGLFPTAYGIAGYEPLLMPMTLALFWGLIVATLLTLVWIPCSILIMEDGKKWISYGIHRKILGILKR
ncbi:MAG: efflux RND transporter permease subunit [Bdellovibrionales bacterium]|nr:efflux RND transporter permease subunit [Bdellovibrionales bacterium]